MYDNPATYPVFESNDDAAMLGISGVFPEEAPMARPQDFTSYVNLSEFFIDLLTPGMTRACRYLPPKWNRKTVPKPTWDFPVVI